MAVLTGEQKKLLIGGLKDAYPTYEDLEGMLDLELDRRLADLAPPGPLPNVLLKVINRSRTEGWTEQLITAATLGNPGNAMLRDVVAGGQLDTAMAVGRLLDQPGGAARDLLPHGGILDGLPRQELQRVVNASVGFQDLVVYATALLTQASRVCRIEVVAAAGGGSGTGILVGPDLVLTNHHVFAPVLDGGASPSGVRCRFDFHIRADGTVDHGVTHGLAPDWLLAASPPSAVDTQPEPVGLPGTDELDYALVRLDARPGLDPVPGRDRRGWLDLLAAPPPIRVGLPLLIVQHPADQPVKIAQDTAGVIGINGNGTRLVYGVNTLRGSSGSPCFTLDLALVAVHHAGTPEFDARRNEGVPIGAIAGHLRAAGLAAALGG